MLREQDKVLRGENQNLKATNIRKNLALRPLIMLYSHIIIDGK